MKLNELETEASNIPVTRNYWFVRTDSGQNFDTFYENDFIGIGWNKITANDIKNNNPEAVKAKIAKSENLDLNSTKGKSKATRIYNKILSFSNLKKGDLIIIPSASSSQLAFGIVNDSKIYIDREKIDKCDYYKRRKVKWLTIKKLSELDSIFYKIIKPIQAIFPIKEYQEYIDNVTDILFKKGDFIHLVFNVESKKPVDLVIFAELMSAIENLTQAADEEFDLAESDQKLTVKINVQSPGLFEIRRRIGKSIVILALLISSCNGDAIVPTGNKKIDNFAKDNLDTLKTIDSALISLQIDRKFLNNQ